MPEHGNRPASGPLWETCMSQSEPGIEDFPNPVVRYIAATRPAFILATVMPILLGLAWTAYSGQALNALSATVTLLAGILLHAAVNVLNDYYDDLNGSDARNEERIFPFTGGSRFIQNGVLSRRQMLVFGLGLLLAVVFLGLWLIGQAGVTLLWLGLFGLLLGWGYSAPPLNLNARGLGELTVLAAFSLLPLGTALVQTGRLSPSLLLVSLPVGLLTANLLYINQFPDRTADRAAGKRHWVARLEPHTARWGYPFIAALAWLILVALIAVGLLPLLALVSLLPAVFSLRAARILLAHASEPRALAPAIPLTILAMLGHGALLALSLTLVAVLQ